MFKRKKTGCQTPKFRKPTAPPQYDPPPMPPVKPPKPNPNYVPPASVKSYCTYKTPCGWCAKWDKKCDKKIGGGNDIEPRKKKNVLLEQIESGQLPPLNTDTTCGLEITKYD